MTTCLVGQGAGEIALAGTGRSGDDEVVALAQPVAAGQRKHERLIEAAGVAVVDVFDGGGLAQAGALKPGLQAAVLAFGVLAVHEHAEAFVKGERVAVGQAHLFDEGLLHTDEIKFPQFVQGGMNKHCQGSPFYP